MTTDIQCSGHAAISHKKRLIVIDNGQGFLSHNLRMGTFIRNFPTGEPTKRFPKQVAFGENDNIIVGGTVYVFDHDTGGPMDLLRHSERGLVQTVMVSCFETSAWRIVTEKIH